MLNVLLKGWALYISMLLISIGLGFQNAILPIIGGKSNFPDGTISYVMSTYYLGFLVGVYIVPRMMKKVGCIRSFAVLATLVSSFIICYGLYVDSLLWIFIRFIMGICFSGLYLITESWLNDSVENSRRGSSLSIYFIAISIGYALGQYIVSLIDAFELVSFVILSLILSISFIPVLLTATRQPICDVTKPMTFKEIYKISPMGIIGVFIIGVGNVFTIALSGDYILNQGLTDEKISYFFTIGSIATFIIILPVGKISDMFDRRKVLVSLCFISLLGAWILKMQNNFLMLILGYMVLNLGLGPMYSICLAQTNDWLKDNERISATSQIVFMYGLGNVVGGILGSSIISVFSYNMYVYLQFIIYFVLLLFLVYRIYIRDKQIYDKKSNFVHSPSRVNVLGIDMYNNKNK